MNGSAVRTSDGMSRAWRLRRWPNDPTVAQLIFVDHQQVPTTEIIDVAVDHARRRGARAIRTSALFPSSAEALASAGFHTIDRLALLRHSLDDGSLDRLGPPGHRVRALQPWMYGRAAAVDQAAFGRMWGNDSSSLRDVRRATPAHRARMITVDRRMAGFALSGAAADSGYLQRLAVAPEHRRRGIAHDLVIDALVWMHAQGRTQCLVNTGVDNVAALALYAHLGFEPLSDLLTIAERPLTE